MIASDVVKETHMPFLSDLPSGRSGADRLYGDTERRQSAN